MNRYSVVYYESAEAMVPSPGQVADENRWGRIGIYYNWDNKKFDEIEASSVFAAAALFMMSHPNAIICAVEDLRLWKNPCTLT